MQLRIFQDDYQIMHDERPNYDKPGCIWSHIHAKKSKLSLNIQPFDKHIEVLIDQISIRETCRLYREVVLIDQ